MTDEFYMSRCLQLAKLGEGYTAPNPMVGAVLVHQQRIIGEGYHQRYGEAHAEVNCVNNVQEKDLSLVPQSTLYVSLEPCSHTGKTPPCTDLIIRMGIKKVVIGAVDSHKAVDGSGIRRLQAAGVDVRVNVLEKECHELNRRFYTFHEHGRPYIILKWAQTADGYIGTGTRDRLLISNEYTNRLVHKWRHEEAAILVGANTALADNPSLTNRLWVGKNPVRILLDAALRVPLSFKILDNQAQTIIFNAEKEAQESHLIYKKWDARSGLHSLLQMLRSMEIQSVFVEGGAHTLQSFIDAGVWDEARIISNPKLLAGKGVSAPALPASAYMAEQYSCMGDEIYIWKREENK